MNPATPSTSSGTTGKLGSVYACFCDAAPGQIGPLLLLVVALPGPADVLPWGAPPPPEPPAHAASSSEEVKSAKRPRADLKKSRFCTGETNLLPGAFMDRATWVCGRGAHLGESARAASGDMATAVAARPERPPRPIVSTADEGTIISAPFSFSPS
jgi:hypothetical protein